MPGAKGWKLRWFVVVDRYLLYFKQRPKMRLNADHWRGMLNAHWRSFNGYSLDQVHTTYLQIAQEYPFYGCTCFSVVFDKYAADSVCVEWLVLDGGSKMLTILFLGFFPLQEREPIDLRAAKRRGARYSVRLHPRDGAWREVRAAQV